MKKIAIGCDPNAAGLKNAIIQHLAQLGYECEDYGSEDPIYANVAIDMCWAYAIDPVYCKDFAREVTVYADLPGRRCVLK